MRMLSHEQAAELLFAGGDIPAHPADVQDRVIAQLLAHGGNAAHFADELAVEYARHPASAAAHMTACLAAVPDEVAVPDWPERDPSGHLYVGLVDE